MKKILLVLAALLLLTSPLADARKIKKQPLRWHEAHGEIVLDGVCDDFAYGSIDYRECRATTLHLFEEHCREYRDKADHSGGARRE